MVMQAHLDTAATLAELLVHGVIPKLPANPKAGALHNAVSIQHQLLICSLPYIMAVRGLLNQASPVCQYALHLQHRTRECKHKCPAHQSSA